MVSYLYQQDQGCGDQILKLDHGSVNDQNQLLLPRFTCSKRDNFLVITKTRLYNFDPFKPHFYIVKLGFTGVYIIIHSSD